MNIVSDNHDFSALLSSAKLDNDYVSATVLAKGYGKRFKNYSRLKETQEVWKAIATRSRSDVSTLVLQPKSGHKGDTLLHPLVAIHFAQWLSPDLAVFMAELLKGYLEASPDLAKSIIDRTIDADVVIEIAEHAQARADYLGDYKPLMDHLAGLEEPYVWFLPNVQKLSNKAITGRDTKGLKEAFGVTNARLAFTPGQLRDLGVLQSIQLKTLLARKVTTAREAYPVLKEVATAFSLLNNPVSLLTKAS